MPAPFKHRLHFNAGRQCRERNKHQGVFSRKQDIPTTIQSEELVVKAFGDLQIKQGKKEFQGIKFW